MMSQMTPSREHPIPAEIKEMPKTGPTERWSRVPVVNTTASDEDTTAAAWGGWMMGDYE